MRLAEASGCGSGAMAPPDGCFDQQNGGIFGAKNGDFVGFKHENLGLKQSNWEFSPGKAGTLEPNIVI